MRKVIVLDTSIFCVWLRLPGFDSCGADADAWRFERIDRKIKEEIEENALLILPLATIIETGNHISQCEGDRFRLAGTFCEILVKSIENESPWAAFSEQNELWSNENIRKLATNWPTLASQKISIGDATIINVANYYYNSGCQVEIFTGDAGLRAWQPKGITRLVPRRRR